MKLLLNELTDLKEDILKVIKLRGDNLDEYDNNALIFIYTHLMKLINEIKNDNMTEKSERYTYIASILIDRDESFLGRDLSSRLINAEKEYMSF